MNSDSLLVTAEQPVLLRNYRPPAWHVRDIELIFDLDPRETVVETRLVLERNSQSSSTVLYLDGDKSLELLDIYLDGRPLAVHEYRRDIYGLAIFDAPTQCVLETHVRIHPERNTALQGLYLSGSADNGFLLTQCEAEGFRHLTFFMDRPDVMARYTVTLRANQARFPVLLANGNVVDAGQSDYGEHWVKFIDPHPKPSYLFALVAGQLEHIEDQFITAEGRQVRLVIHAESSVIGYCQHAMRCVKEAMRWDEQRFGRCYDLDVFHIVATHDFTMGAMENKGLNIFNASYLIADPEHATDDDYRHILAIVGHEYFHNWTGNRITCRDWFQLSLKEGLTVYREQEFESDVASRTLRRIEDVRALWRSQFPEDAGPLAHSVRPEQYSEINNFYTATVYNKGAEIIRMLAALLGGDGFRRGMDLYFSRHDNQAVTVEDFLKALGNANKRDLSDWLVWYRQAGTPLLTAQSRYDPRARCYELTLTQQTSPTPGQPYKQPLPILVAMVLYDRAGQTLPLRLDGELNVGPAERLLLLDSESVTFRFRNVPEAPVASLLRGYSAPVKFKHDADSDALALLIRHDDDGFNRWFAADTLARRLFATTLQHKQTDPHTLSCWTESLNGALNNPELDPALVAELLTIPSEVELSEGLTNIDPEAIYQARDALEKRLAQALESTLLAHYLDLVGMDSNATDPTSQAKRRLQNVCLMLLCKATPQHHALAYQQFNTATNLTNRLSALVCLTHNLAAEAGNALDAFAQRYANAPTVLNKWFSLQAACPCPETLVRIEALTQHSAFRWENPNNIYALFMAFARRNLRVFHYQDGAGYHLLGNAIAKLDAITPQVAARLATAFGSWRCYEQKRQTLMRKELEKLVIQPGISSDLADILNRSLA